MGRNIQQKGNPAWTAWLSLLFLLLLAMCGCSRVQYVPVETVRVDSVSIRDTLIETRLVAYHDSVTVSDTTSYLSNPYAYSRAIWSSGQLSHVLGIHPFAVTRVHVPYFVDRYVRITEPRIVEVENRLNRWQRIKLEAGGVAIGALILTFALIIVHRFLHKGRK